MFRNLTFILLLILSQSLLAQSIKGRVVDSEAQIGIPYAKVFCIETQNGTITDSLGYWEINNMISNKMTLHVTAPEFEGVIIEVDEPSKLLTVELSETHIHLDEVIVSTTESKLQRYNTAPVDSRKLSDLNKIENTTLVGALSNMPGVYNMSTGNGISKPVVRGLSGMRVLTVQNGLRIENQQWGGDHGFALTDLGIDRVEIIKGPSSLIYGADALGGVVYLEDEPYANLNEMEVKASS